MKTGEAGSGVGEKRKAKTNEQGNEEADHGDLPGELVPRLRRAGPAVKRPERSSVFACAASPQPDQRRDAPAHVTDLKSRRKPGMVR